jgi:hypothetical protein
MGAHGAAGKNKDPHNRQNRRASHVASYETMIGPNR